jgi:hypothetical protein
MMAFYRRIFRINEEERDQRVPGEAPENRWFKGALLLCLLIVVGVPAIRVSFIPSTPPGHPNPVKISPLGWITSRYHERKALQILEGSSRGDLIHTWKVALVNDSGNFGYHRSLLRGFITHDRKREMREDAEQAVEKALKIIPGTLGNLELVAEVYRHYHLSESILTLREKHPDIGTVKLERLFFDTMLITGRTDELRSAVRDSGKAPHGDALLELYHTVFCDGANRTQAIEFEERLGSATQVEDTAESALRIRMHLALQGLEVNEFERDLETLQERFDDTIWDHTRFWKLLKDTNQTPRALTLITRHPVRPRSGAELIEIATTLDALGLSDDAFELLTNHEGEFGFSEPAWWLMSQILVKREAWRELQRLAIRLRNTQDVTTDYLTYSLCLSAWSCKELDRPSEAERHLTELATSSIEAPELGMYVATKLQNHGEPKPAYHILEGIRSPLRNSTDYWSLVYAIALELKHNTRCLMAAENIFRLTPEISANRDRYALHLALIRNRSGEALDLIDSSTDDQNDSVLLTLAHGIALVHQDALQAASLVMERLSEADVPRRWRSRYLLAKMEFKFRTEQLGEALDLGQRIKVEDLLPEDRVVFDGIWAQLELELSFEQAPQLSRIARD